MCVRCVCGVCAVCECVCVCGVCAVCVCVYVCVLTFNTSAHIPRWAPLTLRASYHLFLPL